MCVGTIARVVEVRDDDGVRIGILEDSSRVPLAFVPEARTGSWLLLHLGIPVDVLDPEDARDAIAIRGSEPDEGDEQR